MKNTNISLTGYYGKVQTRCYLLTYGLISKKHYSKIPLNSEEDAFTFQENIDLYYLCLIVSLIALKYVYLNSTFFTISVLIFDFVGKMNPFCLIITHS